MPCPRLDLAREYWRHDEGALLDVYIDPLHPAERQAVVDAVLGLGWEWSYDADGVERPLSATDGELAQPRLVGVRIAAAPRPGFWFHGWLYDDDVELDVDPRDIASQDELDCLCDLVRAVGRSTDRRVFVGIEGSRTSPLMWYDPKCDDVMVGDVPEPAPPSLWSRILESVKRRGR